MTTLNGDARELLAAILDVLDVPLAANVGDEVKYRMLLESRISVVRCSVRALLRESEPDMRFDATVIRKGIESCPATYPVYEAAAPAGKDTSDAPQAAAGESTQSPACARCRTPFDPADPRQDGHAQHARTPFCRRCVDHCHEAGDADHRCAVCCAPIGDESTGGTR